MFAVVLPKKTGLVLVAAIMAGVSCRAPRAEHVPTNANSTASQDSLSGTFHIIFDPQRYFVIDGTGKSTELVFEGVNSASPPNLLKYDRHRVTVVGRRDSRNERFFHVSEIAAIEDR